MTQHRGALPGSIAAARPTFDQLCAVWPMRSEAERVQAYAAFYALPHSERAGAIAGVDAYRALCTLIQFEAGPVGARFSRSWWAGWLALARFEPRVARLMKGAA